MAKLGGEQTELLQVSADERARAARTAMLFTEEELTRNLQIVLRTFDDLNYRQEQRFHLELGLLKLIHAQRLLPIEELLSGVASGAGVRATAAAAISRPPSVRPANPAPQATPAPPAAPALSPFGTAGGGWSTGPTLKQSAASVPVAAMERPPAARVSQTEPSPKTVAPPEPFPASSSSPLRESADAAAEDQVLTTPQSAVPPGPLTVEALRQAICPALEAGGHSSASLLLASGSWTLDGPNLRIEVGIGKKMLSLTVNAAAEKIIRQELQRLGAAARFLIVPGESGGSAPAPVAAPAAGSIQATALAHPLVQRAKEIFKAEVRSVVDLHEK
jgi:DNA polymerase-3 subunit gamma/tau